jgi:hypothetical protein
MTVQEFINSFSSEDLNKELFFNYLFITMTPEVNVHTWTNTEYDTVLKNRGYYQEKLDKNSIIVELV